MLTKLIPALFLLPVLSFGQTSLTASPVSPTQINLTWNATTGASYTLQRCQGAGCANFSQIASPTGTAYSDTGLTPGTSYSYKLQPILAPSNTASATTQAAQQSSSAVRIWSGSSSSYTDPSGNVWAADFGFTGGQTYSASGTVSGTTTPQLYLYERFGTFSYNVPVQPGSYTVSLKFAEIYWTQAGKRVFNVSINGTQVLSNFDIYAAAGARTAIDKSFPVTTSSNQIAISFQTVVDNAKISSIEIVPSSSSSPPPTYSVAFSWAASTSQVVGYNVYESGKSGGPYTKLTATPVASLSYTDSHVAGGQTRYYIATAVDASGNESMPSNEVQAVMP
jgi:fibronectin type 3 domain-containing protein